MKSKPVIIKTAQARSLERMVRRRSTESLASLKDTVAREELSARLHELRLRNKGDVLDGKKRHILLAVLDGEQTIRSGNYVQVRASDLYRLPVLGVDDVGLHKISRRSKSPNDPSSATDAGNGAGAQPKDSNETKT